MPNPVISGSTLAAGLRSTFADAYRARYKGLAEVLPKVMELDLPSDKLTEPYAAFESSPYPERWPRGAGVASKNFKDFGWTTKNHRWGRKVEWSLEDREDDQTKSLFDQAKSAGTNWASLHERIFFQILLGTTDITLLPAVPNAPDGAALHAAGRLGLAAGNIVTGTGVATGTAVRADFWGVNGIFSLMQDTEGQPLHDKSVIDGEFVVLFGAANTEVFREAFTQGRTLDGNAAVTNTILESGLKVNLWPTARITDNDWFVFAVGAPHRPIYHQVRSPLTEAVATAENSDTARNTDIEYIRWRSRGGYGVYVPYGTMKVNN